MRVVTRMDWALAHGEEGGGAMGHISDDIGYGGGGMEACGSDSEGKGGGKCSDVGVIGSRGGGGSMGSCGNGGGGWSPSSVFLEQSLEREISPFFLQMTSRVCGGVFSPLLEPKMGREGKGPT